jgi:hypothetical protein
MSALFCVLLCCIRDGPIPHPKSPTKLSEKVIQFRKLILFGKRTDNLTRDTYKPTVHVYFHVRGCIQKSPDWVITKQTTTTTNTRREATQRVMAAKLTRLSHKIPIQLHLVAESYTTCSSCSRWPVRKLLDTLSYILSLRMTGCKLVPMLTT